MTKLCLRLRWVLLLWALFFAGEFVLPAAFGYDWDNNTSAYGSDEAATPYDAPANLRSNEDMNEPAGGRVLCANFAGFLAAKTAPTIGEGTTVFRVWGDEAGAWGRSWTTVDPRTVPGYRNAAGLPTQNTGRFISEGILQNTEGVTTRGALPLHGNAGGLPEVVIPNPAQQIKLQNVQGLNPQF